MAGLRIAVASLLVFFVVGGLILWGVQEPVKKQVI
jgi:MFS-type transporter involved in bile tolerance (Atg22 family)